MFMFLGHVVKRDVQMKIRSQHRRFIRFLSLFLCSGALYAPQAQGQLDPTAFIDAADSCDPSLKYCLPVEVWLASVSDEPVCTPEWLASQLSLAQTNYAEIGVGFELTEVHELPESQADIETRSDRDALGHDRWTQGVIHVFVVGRLANVDEEGYINGVHWRDRDDTGHRWVILSSTAWRLTLAHEFGHFFRLSHSEYNESMMNREAGVPFDELTFHEDEFDRMLRVITDRVEDEVLQNLSGNADTETE